jgi:hypothetical protein
MNNLYTNLYQKEARKMNEMTPDKKPLMSELIIDDYMGTANLIKDGSLNSNSEQYWAAYPYVALTTVSPTPTWSSAWKMKRDHGWLITPQFYAAGFDFGHVGRPASGNGFAVSPSGDAYNGIIMQSGIALAKGSYTFNVFSTYNLYWSTYTEARAFKVTFYTDDEKGTEIAHQVFKSASKEWLKETFKFTVDSQNVSDNGLYRVEIEGMTDAPVAAGVYLTDISLTADA